MKLSASFNATATLTFAALAVSCADRSGAFFILPVRSVNPVQQRNSPPQTKHPAANSNTIPRRSRTTWPAATKAVTSTRMMTRRAAARLLLEALASDCTSSRPRGSAQQPQLNQTNTLLLPLLRCPATLSAPQNPSGSQNHTKPNISSNGANGNTLSPHPGTPNPGQNDSHHSTNGQSALPQASWRGYSVNGGRPTSRPASRAAGRDGTRSPDVWVRA
ncbi:hypothetical protein K438DRAFT_2012110 [Mycena galopus ATCC 62051]|nr:hypothetical protein K438DRAFT_2012110 [Mycena galopus ATCC 62051]